MQANQLDALATVSARPLTGDDYKTLLLAALGGTLEYYDFVIFVFFAPVIGQLFFTQGIPDWLRQLETFGIFAAGYLARPLGGIVMAHFGDLLGRKRMFLFSVLIMAAPTLLIGLLPTYAQVGVTAPALLLVLRLLQGAAVGGEIPGAWVFVAEHAPRRHIGFACGVLTGGLTAGILLGSLIATSINTHFSAAEIAAHAWRLPFLIGGVFGLCAAYLRRWLRETPVFAELARHHLLAAELPLKIVMRDHRRAMLISMLLTYALVAAVVVVILMTPALLQKHYGLTPAVTLEANTVATLCLTLGCVASGKLVDWIGAKRTLTIGFALLAVGYCAMLILLGDKPSILIPMYALAGLLAGVIGAIPWVLVNAFPPALRYSGIAFSFNVVYAIAGGLTPIVIALLVSYSRLMPAFYVVLACGVGIAAARLIREPHAG